MYIAICYWSEGFPRAAYFVPGRDGIGVWPISKIVPPSAAASVTNTSKHLKTQKQKPHHWALEKRLGAVKHAILCGISPRLMPF